MNIIEMLVRSFCAWPPLGQAVFALIVLVGLGLFILTLFHGYPKGLK